MERFNRTLHGYDPVEVNDFLDNIISQVEKIIEASKQKDVYIESLKKELSTIDDLKARLEHYERMEENLSRTIELVQKTSDQIRVSATKEGELIVENARRNADRIVNNALLKAEQTEREATMLRRNINVFKNKLRDALEQQLEMVNDIEKIDF